MRNVLIASHGHSPLCRSLAGSLRPLVGGCLVDYRYGEQLERLKIRWGFDLSEFGFLLLGLSTINHQEESAERETEVRLINEAFGRKMPVGIVCNQNGGISVPYLKGEQLDRISLVVSNGYNAGCEPTGVFPKAEPFDIKDGAGAIAACIKRGLPALPPAPSPQGSQDSKGYRR